MKKKALFSYGALLVIVFAAHAFNLVFFDYLVPLYMVAVPLALRKRIAMDISFGQIALTLIVCVSVLLPFYCLFFQGRRFVPPGAVAAMVQLFGVAFPEEVFFRGFLQDLLGNNIRGVVVVSLLFAAAHLPGLIFYSDPYAPLTFFPSLVMGFLYLRTSSVIPSTIFHFLSNVIYNGGM